MVSRTWGSCTLGHRPCTSGESTKYNILHVEELFENSRLIRRFMDLYVYINAVHSPGVLLGPSGPLSMSSCHQGLLCQSLPSQGIQKIPEPETTCTLESIEY